MHSLSPIEEFVVRVLADCGAATARQFHQLPDPISPRWLSSFARERGFIQLEAVSYRGRNVRFVTLTPAGKAVARGVLGVSAYRAVPAQLLHDLTLTGYYLRLRPDLRSTWQNPSALLAAVTAAPRQRVPASYPDGLYVDGGAVAVEVVGAKLTRAQIEKKRTTAGLMWRALSFVVVKVGEYADADL